MKDILTAPFVTEMTRMMSNMYRLGYDERNGGNISVLLDADDVAKYLNLDDVQDTIHTGFEAPELVGKLFIVTGSGKYFKNAETDPENNLGIIRIAGDGTTAELLWGLADGGRPTSELPAHLMSHIVRMKADPQNRVIMHCHPDRTLALTHVLPLDEKTITRTLWGMMTESIVVFPDGVGVLPWMVCGTNEIGRATAEKMKQYRIVLWAIHGIYGSGRDLDEAFGLIETVEKAAIQYFLTAGLPRVNFITDEKLVDLAKAFKLDYRKDFLDL